LWRLPEAVEKAVRAQLDEMAATMKEANEAGEDKEHG